MESNGGKSTAGIFSGAGGWVLISTILASSMAFIDGTALNVALPAIQADLDADGPELLWVLNAYLLMLAALILIGGSIGDKRGRKKTFMIGIALFIVASLACGLSPTIEVLIAARAIQGIGGALMIPGSLAIITASFAQEGRGRAIGAWSASTSVVTVAGPVLGGVLADAGLWRGVFLINIPIGIAALVALALKVPESRDEESSGTIDYPGAALAALGLAGLTYAFIAAPDHGWDDPTILTTLIIGVAALVGFIVVEARSRRPMMPLALFASRTFTGANLLTLFLYGALNVAMFFLSLNMVQIQGYSQSAAGFAFLPFAALLILISPLMGTIVDRYGPRVPLIVGPALSGTGLLLMGLIGRTNGPADYWATFFPALLVFGGGMAITVVPLTTAAMGAAPHHYAGTASGINNAVSRAAGVLAIAVLGAVMLLRFADTLEAQAAAIPSLTDAARQSLRADATKLGAVPVPAGAPAEAVRSAVAVAFDDAFSFIMIVCAGLAWLSAAAAALLVEGRTWATGKSEI